MTDTQPQPSTDLPPADLPPADQPLDEEERTFAAQLGRRYADGEPLGQILGVERSYLEELEHRAYQFYLAGRFDHATTVARGIAALDPDRYFPHLLLGDVDMQNDDIEAAAEKFARAHALLPDDPCVMGKLGECRLRLGKVTEGMALLRRVVVEADERSPHWRRAQAILRSLERMVEQKAAARSTPTNV